MKEMAVALRIKAQDMGSKDVQRAIGDIDKQVQRSGQAQQRSTVASQRAVRREISQTGQTDRAIAQQRVRDSEQAGRAVMADARRMHQARARLGVTSERALQNEIVRTAIAYKRLEQSGKLSGRELARAAEAAQAKIRQLKAEMNRFETPKQIGKGMLAVGGGLMAGGAMAQRAVAPTMSYDRQVALLSNTAYADQDKAGRQAGQGEIKQAVSAAVKAGGGTREGAAEALSALLGEGGMGRDDAFALLPQLQKMALASGTNGVDLVPLVGKLRAQGIDAKSMPDALGKVLHSSETGGFGLDAMMSSLPEILEQQKLSGLSGMGGLEAALSTLQGVTQETGSASMSAQSTLALMQALNNPMVAAQASKNLSIGGNRVDLAPTIAKGAAQGVSPLETMAAAVDRSMAKNKDYQRLKSKLSAQGAGQAEIDQFASFLDSKVMKDMGIPKNALSAFSAFMKQRESISSMRADYAGIGASSIDTSAATMLDTADEKANMAGQAVEEARSKALAPLAEAVGDVSAKISEYAAQYPTLTASVVGAGDAIKIMTAAALAFGGIKMLTGGAGKGFGLGSIAKGVAGNAVMGGASLAASGTRALVQGAGRAAPIASLALGAYEGYQVYNSEASDEDKAIGMTRVASSAVGGVAGAWAGGAAGAAIGSVVPVVGTAIGGAIGAILGGMGGGALMDSIGEGIGEFFFGSGKDGEDGASAKAAGPQEPRPLAVDLNVKVDVDNGNIVASVNEVNAREGRRH